MFHLCFGYDLHLWKIYDIDWIWFYYNFTMFVTMVLLWKIWSKLWFFMKKFLKKYDNFWVLRTAQKANQFVVQWQRMTIPEKANCALNCSRRIGVFLRLILNCVQFSLKRIPTLFYFLLNLVYKLQNDKIRS